MFYVDDDFHAEFIDRFETFDLALNELEKISKILFGEEPNMPPCLHWEECERDYHITQYDNKYNKILSLRILTLTKNDLIWYYNINNKGGDEII